MADPVVRKRMMAIMQKRMGQRAGGHSMMMPGGPGGNAMQGGATRSGSSSHEAHHTPAPLMSAAPCADCVPRCLTMTRHFTLNRLWDCHFTLNPFLVTRARANRSRFGPFGRRALRGRRPNDVSGQNGRTRSRARLPRGR
jgi:hypothetical protein